MLFNNFYYSKLNNASKYLNNYLRNQQITDKLIL